MEDILSKSWEEEVEEESWFKDWWEIAEMELEKEEEWDKWMEGNRREWGNGI